MAVSMDTGATGPSGTQVGVKVWLHVNEESRNPFPVSLMPNACVFDALTAGRELVSLGNSLDKVTVTFEGNEVRSDAKISDYTTSDVNPLLLELPEQEEPLPKKRKLVAGSPSEDEASVFLRKMQDSTIDEERVLKLEGIPWCGIGKDCKSIYVRSPYNDLHHLVNTDNQSYIITGNPGIGKSYFALYELYKAVNEPKSVMFYHQVTNTTFTFVPGEGATLSKGVTHYFNGLFLHDSGTKRSPKLAAVKRTIIFCSPDRDSYVDLEKQGAQVLYMPVWSEEEILHHGTYLRMGMDEVKERYSKFGGIPRYVLTSKSDWLSQLERTCNGVEVTTLLELRRLKGWLDSHLIFHVKVTDSTYEVYELDFASDYVENRVCESIEKTEQHSCIEFLRTAVDSPDLGTLRGRIFERKAHEFLQKGGKFQIRSLGGSKCKSSLCLQKSELRQFHKITEVEWEGKDKYWKPTSKNFPSVDALMPPDMAFQMTVSSIHGIKSKGLEGLPEIRTPLKLYFVLPSDQYAKFKQQTVETPEGLTIEQYALHMDFN